MIKSLAKITLRKKIRQKVSTEKLSEELQWSN